MRASNSRLRKEIESQRFRANPREKKGRLAVFYYWSGSEQEEDHLRVTAPVKNCPRGGFRSKVRSFYHHQKRGRGGNEVGASNMLGEELRGKSSIKKNLLFLGSKRAKKEVA